MGAESDDLANERLDNALINAAEVQIGEVDDSTHG
jgi:hypothetical protein